MARLLLRYLYHTLGGLIMKTQTRIAARLMLAIPPLIIATGAEARRADREGLNFGSSIRILDNDDRGESNSLNKNSTRTKSSGQAFSPYVGYAFGPLNLGLMLNVETKAEEFTESNASNGQQLNRQATTSSKAVSLFTRFNFGKIMYLGAGAGLYSQNTDVRSEVRSSTGETFTGSTNTYKLRGIGPGYHAGIGIELPAVNGFFFTGAYVVHNYTLRDTANSGYGSVIGTQQKRELSFGIAYYN
jgi:hypothetical protein